MDAKKKNISLRVSHQDLDRVKRIAGRMDVKEADLIRFAVKQLLNGLLPLQEGSYSGTDLLPALIEYGPALSDFFELSSEELDQIVNGAAPIDRKRIELEDLRLISMFGANEEYAKLKLLQSQSCNAAERHGDLKSYLQSKYFSVERPNTETAARTVDDVIVVDE